MAKLSAVSAASTDAERVLTQATLRAADTLGINQGQLAVILGLSESTISRQRKGQITLDPALKSWELAALFVRLFRGLDALMGGDDDASHAWLANPNLHLKGVPLERIMSVTGLVEVVAYVDAFRAKV